MFDRAALEKALGLDVPMHVQYGRWLTGIVLRGSLGDSLRSHLPVTQMIGSRIGVTFELGFLAVVMSLLISLPIGIYSAVRQDTVGDFAARSVAIVFIAVPSFLGGDAGGALPRESGGGGRPTRSWCASGRIRSANLGHISSSRRSSWRWRWPAPPCA